MEYIEKSDLESIKELALEFLDIEPEVNEQLPFLVYHPFFEYRHTLPDQNRNDVDTNNVIDITKDTEEFKKIKARLCREIKEGSIDIIFMLLRKSYCLTFLKYAKPHMSKNDFEKHLIDQWICSENPNQDNNVSINEFIGWFSHADRENLMSKSELEYYNALPDEVTVYRGIGIGRAEAEGLSWTCNYDTAKWFAERFSHSSETGYIVKGTISKTDIFAYLNSRGEDEILCNSRKIKDIKRID